MPLVSQHDSEHQNVGIPAVQGVARVHREGTVIMVHYKELGLVNSKELFEKAMEDGYAIPAYNFNNLEQLQAIITACSETRSPALSRKSP